MMKPPQCPVIGRITILQFAFTIAACAAILDVGPGRSYPRIESAYEAAGSGDSLLVYPQSGNAAYEKVALYATKKKIVISGAVSAPRRVTLSGEGYDYSGAGSVPRAMFQFNPGSDSCVIENLEIAGCHNTSRNGAAFRINQANGVTIRNCVIHGNDMGIMSNGSAAAGSAADQLIENCVISDNGNAADPGYNHNLYLGGTSATVRGCNIRNATTGHNLKSRAHLTIVEACYLHDSPNRELDLVDESGNTTIDGSHALLSGCVIVKAPNTTGNKTVIHFGQDGGNDHKGTLYLVHCTVVTPYLSPVVDLSAAGAGVCFWNCLVLDGAGSAKGQTLVAVRNGAVLTNAAGHYLWMSSGFSAPAGGTFGHVTVGSEGRVPRFVGADSGNYRLADSFAGIVDAGADLSAIVLPGPFDVSEPLAFAPPFGFTMRTFIRKPDIGAQEWGGGAGTIGNRHERFDRCAGRPYTAAFDLLGRLSAVNRESMQARTVSLVIRSDGRPELALRK